MKYIFDDSNEKEEKQSVSVRRTRNSGEDAESDTEITLGVRSLLGIFFGLVLVCGIFFGLGYSVGRGSNSHATAMQPASDTTSSASSAPKPSAQESLTAAQPEATAATQGDSVEAASDTSPAAQSDGAATSGNSTPQAMPVAAVQKQATVVSADESRTVPVTSNTTPEISRPAPAVPTSAPAQHVTSKPSAALMPAPAQNAPTEQPEASEGNFMVQIAAVRLREDANILVSALEKRGYSAVVRNEPQDQLMHVQVGPFVTRAEANAMRARLLHDGYNAVVK